MTGIYRLADMNILLTTFYGETHRLLADYRADGAEPDFSLTVTGEDIEYEREAHRAKGRGAEPGGPYLETLAVYRMIAGRAPDYGAVLFHGSCVAAFGEGYLFIAPGGTGKSTHARLWREMLGNDAVMINDDKPLVRATEGGIRAYGTPWDGKHRLSVNASVPLRAVCALFRAPENTIRRMDRREAYAALLRHCYRPPDPAALGKTLGVIDRIADGTAVWTMGCNTDICAAETAYHAMREQNEAQR